MTARNKKNSSRRPPTKQSSRALLRVGSPRQMALSISNHLEQQGIRTILIGKGSAALYAPSLKVTTYDFVTSEYHVEHMRAIMAKIGFRPRETRTFVSKKCEVEVHFHAAPPVVGDEPIDHPHTLKGKEGTLQLLNPTDCVRHRLAAWFRWGDQDALDEAVAVARRQKIDFDIVKRWSEWEWSADKYEEFLVALKSGV